MGFPADETNSVKPGEAAYVKYTFTLLTKYLNGDLLNEIKYRRCGKLNLPGSQLRSPDFIEGK